MQQLEGSLKTACAQSYAATSLINGKPITEGEAQSVLNPADHSDTVGSVTFAHAQTATAAIDAALAAQTQWAATPAAERAGSLKRFADLLEQHAPTLMMLAVREAGKTLANALAEVREAVDFLPLLRPRSRAHPSPTTPVAKA